MGREVLSHLSETPPIPRKTRRDVLKGALALTLLSASGVTATELIGHEPLKLPERPREPMVPGVVIIDFAPETIQESYSHFEQDIFVRNEEALLRDRLGDYYIPENERARSYMWSAIKHKFGGANPRDEFIKNYPYMSMAMGAVDLFHEHGKSVVDGMRRVYWMLDVGYSITPDIVPIQIAFNEFTFTPEDDGNQTMMTRLNMNRIIDMLDRYPDQNIVNFSWQAGSVGFTYPKSEYHGAYEKERAVESLRELIQMVDAYPEKMFFAAAGNNGDDIREARKLLEANDEWPENLLLAAEWERDDHGYGRPANDVYGGDIYSDPKPLALWGGSTQSTQTMSSLAAYLQMKGYEIPQAIPEIKRILLEECAEQEEYIADPISFVPPLTEKAKVFSPELFVNFLRRNTDYDGDPYIGSS
jgi:hypothetical protein